MIEIELPDGTVLEAPDDADPSAVAKNYLRKQKTAALKASNPGEYDPTSKEWQDKYGPTAGMSGYQKFMAGAGKSVVDMGRGLKQIGLEVAEPFTGSGAADRYRKEVDETKRQDAPLMQSGAGISGNIAGSLATTLIPAAGAARGAQALNMGKTALAANAFVNPATYKGAAAAGAALGALQPVGTEDSRAANSALGAGSGLVGQGIARGVGHIAKPLKNNLTPVDSKAVDTLKRAGVPLDAAQQSGNQRAMQLKRFLTDNPVTASGQVAQHEKTAQGFTRAALREIGENADVADEEVLGRAASRIGRVFDDISSRTNIKADDKLLNDLTNILARSQAALEQPQARLIAGQVDEVINKAAATGSIEGAAYQNIKSNLDLLTNTSGPGVKTMAAELRGKLDEALQRSASEADYAALKLARKQYGALDRIVQATNPDGNVSPSKLYNATNTKSFGQKKAMATGIRQTQLQKLAKAGKHVIPEKYPNSGTTGRAALQLLVPGVLAGGYGYGSSESEDPSDKLMTAAKFAGAGILAPKLLQQTLNRPGAANYLANGLTGPTGRALTATETQLLLKQLPRATLQSQQQ